MSCASYDQNRFCKKFAHYSLSGCLWRDSAKDHICICAIMWVLGILLGLVVMALIVGTWPLRVIVRGIMRCMCGRFSELFSAISAYLCDLCVNCSGEKY
jgi:hypothetical protein